MDDAVPSYSTKYVIFFKTARCCLKRAAEAAQLSGELIQCLLGDLDSLPYEYSRLHKSSQRSPKHR